MLNATKMNGNKVSTALLINIKKTFIKLKMNATNQNIFFCIFDYFFATILSNQKMKFRVK